LPAHPEQKAVDGLRPHALCFAWPVAIPLSGSRGLASGASIRHSCYASVKNILVNNLDRLPTEAAMDERGQRVFRFSRRGTDFDPQLFGIHQLREVHKWMNWPC